MGYLDDAYKELAAVESFLNRSNRATEIARQTPRERVAKANDVAGKYPFFTAGALMSLVRGGFPEDSDNMVQRLGELSTKRWMRDHPNAQLSGPVVTPGMIRRRAQQRAMTPGQVRMAETATPQAGGVPIPSRTEEPDAHQAFLDLQRNGLLRRGVPVEPTSDNTRSAEWKAFLRAQDTIAATGQPFMFHARNGRIGLTEPDRNSDRGFSIRYVDERPEREPSEGGGGGGGIFSPQLQMAGAGIESNISGAVRTAFMAADFPVQELQGQIRNIYGATHGKKVDWLEPQSDLLIALEEGLDETGNGLFVDPESKVAQERRKREAERGQIGGHNVTLGRWAADALPLAPDSKPFQLVSGLVDLGVQIADPTAAALGTWGKVGKARKLFVAPEAEEAAGLFRGVRNVINGPKVGQWLDSKEGVRRIEWLKNTNDSYDVYTGLNRKVGLDVSARLADTRTTDEVRTVLEKELGTSIRRVSDVEMPRFLGQDPVQAADKITEMPSRGPIDAHRGDLIGAELEKWLFNAKAPREVIAKHMDSVARAGDDPILLNASVRDAVRSADGLLAKEGVNERLRSKFLRIYDNAHEEGSRTWIDSVARQGQSDNVIALGGGDEAWDTMAHLYVEQAPDTLRLPDARNIRRVTSKYKTIMAQGDVHRLGKGKGLVNEEAGELRVGFAAAEFLQNELWKPLQLATRIAWPVRVIGEEQIRMAAAGYDSMFNHPLSFISWRTSKKGEIDVKGGLIKESNEHNDTLAQTHGGFIDEAVPTGGKTIYLKERIHEQRAFTRARASELAKLSHDPVARKVALADDLEEVKTWFSRGGGNKYRSGMARAHPDKFGSPEAADAYIESVSRRIHNATGGNSDLLDAVRTGKLGDADILSGPKLDSHFVDRLVDYHDSAPDRLVGDELHMTNGKLGPRMQQKYDRAVDKLFGILMTNRTNNLSRSPVFKQAYWQEAERLLAFGDAGARRATLAAAKDANLGSRQIRRMERLAKRTKEGKLTLDEMDVLAKGHGLDSTKELLYDLTRKGRAMDAMRVVFPFGEAWKEVMTRWFGSYNVRAGRMKPGLLWENRGKSVRRFQQILQGARSEELADFLGNPEGQGFFYENKYGEQVFNYPGSQLLTDTVLGVPIPLTGRVQGLSMFGTVMPGLGPVAQVPVGWFLESKPGPEWFKQAITNVLDIDLGPLGTAKEQVLPFGATGAEDQSEIFNITEYVPPWIKSAIQTWSKGDLNSRQWNTSVMEIAGYLRSTGEYNNSPEDQNRLFEDASKRARGFFFIKTLAGAVAPAAPDKDWLLEQNNGQLIRAFVLSEELRALQKEDYDSSGNIFLEKYGEDLFQIIGTSMSSTANYATPVTKDGVEWVLMNPGIEDKLPNAYGFFAPETGEDDFSLYNANFRKGEALRHHPPNWIQLQNGTIAGLLYRQYIDEVGEEHRNTELGRAYLREKRQELDEQYPGWQNEKGEIAKAPTQDIIREFYRSLDNPAAMRTDAGRGLRLYLEARDEVVSYAQAENDGVWPSTSEKMAPARAFLHDRALDIMDQHPGFERMYEFVLSRETEEE